MSVLALRRATARDHLAQVALVIFTAVAAPGDASWRQLPIADVRGDIVLLVAIAAGLESDAERGAIVGFVAGLAFDLLLDTPVGLSALTYALVGYVRRHVPGRGAARSSWWIPCWSRRVGQRASGVLLFALLDLVVGQATVDPARLPAIVGVVAVVNALLLAPAALGHAARAAATPAMRTDRVFLRHRS